MPESQVHTMRVVANVRPCFLLWTMPAPSAFYLDKAQIYQEMREVCKTGPLYLTCLSLCNYLKMSFRNPVAFFSQEDSTVLSGRATSSHPKTEKQPSVVIKILYSSVVCFFSNPGPD